MNPFGLLIIALGVLLVISGFRGTKVVRKGSSGGGYNSSSGVPGQGSSGAPQGRSPQGRVPIRSNPAANTGQGQNVQQTPGAGEVPVRQPWLR